MILKRGRDFFIKNNDTIFKILILVLTILFLLRILWLDADLPSYGLSYYMPIDEGLYSKMSLNLYNSHSLYNNGTISFYTAPSYRTNILFNFLQYVFLNIFGDNYFSFRLPSVIFSILLLVFTLKTVNIICKKRNISCLWSKVLIIGVFAFMCIDFQYLLASRVIENSILRALSLIVSIYYYLKIEDIRKKYFITSFISVCSIFFIYFSNVFVAIPFLFIIIIKYIKGSRDEAKIIFKYSFYGFLLAFSLAELYYLLVWHSGAFYNLFSAIMDYSNRLIGGNSNVYNQSSNIFEGIIYNSFYMFGSNMFIFNFTFEIFSIISVVYLLFKNKNKSNDTELFIILFIIAFFIQSLIASDGIERKSFVIYPLLIISICILFIDYKNQILNIKKIKLFHIILFIFIVLYCAYSCYRTKIYKGHYLDLNPNEISVLVITILLQLFLISVSIAWIYFSKNKKVFFSIILFSILPLIFSNIYFSAKYIYINRTYTEKQVMIDLGNDVGSDFVLGPYVYGYTLYNDLIPVSNTVEKFRMYIENNDAKYYLHYASINNSPYLNEEIFGKKEQTVSLLKSYYRIYKSDGIQKQVGLFKKCNEEGEKNQ